MPLWNARHTSPPFWCPLSPQMAKHISFSPSPSTGLSLVGFSHLLFLPSLLHLRLFLCILQMRILSQTHSSPVYTNQPLRLGAAVMGRTSGTPQDSSLQCWELSYTIWKVTLQLLPEVFVPLGQGFRPAKKSLNREFFLCYFWFHLLSISLEILWDHSLIGIICHFHSGPDCNNCKDQIKWKPVRQWILKSGWFWSYGVHFTLG